MAARWTIWDQESGLDIAICGKTRADIWLEVTEPLAEGWEAIYTFRPIEGAFRCAEVNYKHVDHEVNRRCPKMIRREAKIDARLDEIRDALEAWAEFDLEIASVLDLSIEKDERQQCDRVFRTPEERAWVHQVIGFDGLNIRLRSARGRPSSIDTVEVVKRRKGGETYAEIEKSLGVARGTVANRVARDRKRGILPPRGG